MFAYRILMIVLFGWHASLFFFFIIVEFYDGIFIGNILRNIYIVYAFCIRREYWYEGKVNIDYCLSLRVSFVFKSRKNLIVYSCKS